MSQRAQSGTAKVEALRQEADKLGKQVEAGQTRVNEIKQAYENLKGKLASVERSDSS